MSYFGNSQEEHFLFRKIDSLYKNDEFKLITDTNKNLVNTLNGEEKAHYYYILGKSFENLNKEDSALAYYKKALDLNNSLKLFKKSTEINNDIYLLLDSQKHLNSNKEVYLNSVYEYAKKYQSNKWFSIYYMNLGIHYLKKNLPDTSKNYLKLAYKYAPEKNIEIKKDLNSLLGSLYSGKYKNHDSALYFYNQALKLCEQDSILNDDANAKFNLYNNIGNTYKRKKEYELALKFFHLAEKIKLYKLNTKSKKILFNNISGTYYYMKNWEKAYLYLYKYDSIKNIINLKEQNTQITEIQEQYDNEKLRADNLEIESKRKQNRNLLIGSLVFILFGGTTAFLVQKNTRKKQKLAEQEKALESQKLATVLKEQELVSIDAMIEGQEKERQRIANDLHDDLGGLMATLKLHFNVLKDKQTPDLFDKTTNLLDEAYQKIRSIAHAKNSGVIAKQGLLKAVENMADKISTSNKISIEVIDHGLENRLENSLELTIFRIIQELITNIIKHAHATEATIHLTNYEDTLNIMVEDNGKGFNPKQITVKNKGMGLSSIDKRVEHLNGTMTIESEINNGTTIILDIPT